MMQLFVSPTSPFVRKIMVLGAEYGISAQITPVFVAGTVLDAGSLPVAHNPLGKIPSLLLEDGLCLHDSRVITRYLDDRFDLGVYPKGPMLWPALAREAVIDGMIEASVAMVYELRLRPAPIQFAPWIEGQWAKIARGLAMFDAAPPADALADSPLDMIQIALGCVLAHLDFRHSARDWRSANPNLAAWYETVRMRAAFVATTPPV